MTSSLLEHFDVTLFNNLSYDERILDWLSLLKQPICEVELKKLFILHENYFPIHGREEIAHGTPIWVQLLEID